MDQTARSDRVHELTRLTKTELIRIIKRDGHLLWTAHPLEKWSKFDLINEVLRMEGLAL